MRTLALSAFALAFLALAVDKIHNEHRMTEMYERQAVALEGIIRVLDCPGKDSAECVRIHNEVSSDKWRASDAEVLANRGSIEARRISKDSFEIEQREICRHDPGPGYELKYYPGAGCLAPKGEWAKQLEARGVVGQKLYTAKDPAAGLTMEQRAEKAAVKADAAEGRLISRKFVCPDECPAQVTPARDFTDSLCERSVIARRCWNGDGESMLVNPPECIHWYERTVLGMHDVANHPGSARTMQQMAEKGEFSRQNK